MQWRQGITFVLHAAVAAGRAAHFRARISSGMRDAHDCEHKVRAWVGEPCGGGQLLQSVEEQGNTATATVPDHARYPAGLLQSCTK
jgi:hypothetical protein